VLTTLKGSSPAAQETFLALFFSALNFLHGSFSSLSSPRLASSWWKEVKQISFKDTKCLKSKVTPKITHNIIIIIII